MKKLYLIRHALPDFPDGRRWCIGRTDLPLSTVGRLQACVLQAGLQEKAGAVGVFCSSLKRSRETAQYLCGEPIIWNGLLEQDAGEWDGRSFEEIKRRWPELYAARGENPELQPPGAESSEAALCRFLKAIGEIVDEHEGDIAVVAHKTVIQLFLCWLSQKEFCRKKEFALPYASVTTLAIEEIPGGQAGPDRKPERERYILQSYGVRMHPPCNETLCRQLLACAGTPGEVKKHCWAVAREAERIAGELLCAGERIDPKLVMQGALLHDIARGCAHHDTVGADWLSELGYEQIARVIRSHHDLDGENENLEAAVIYLADKCMQGEKKVSIEERFAVSADKCKSPEAQKAHRRRYIITIALKKRINTKCGKDVVI
jgi:putative nucleotidyltransferase with HDIG domain